MNEKPWVKPQKWVVSPFNYVNEIRAGWKLPERVLIHDVTLRDGEQTPGVVFRKKEKLKIAHALADIGVQRIEGGMVAVSPEDARAIATMAKNINTAEIASFVRTRKDDIDLAIKCDVDRITLETPSRTFAIKSIWGSTERAVETLVNLIVYAKEHGLKVSSFLMDATRASLDEVKTLILPAVNEGRVDNIVVVDTTGCALPQSFAWLIRRVKEMVNVPIEVHCHNDWGLATANSLAAVTAGAEVIHTTVNGLGGNAALEECVMGLNALLGIDTPIKTRKFSELSLMLKNFSRANWFKPIVGELVGLIEVGIATASIWKDPDLFAQAFRPLNLELVGRKNEVIVLGKKSGRYSIMLKAKELNLPIPSEEASYRILEKIKRLSNERKRLITDEEFKKIYKAEIGLE